MYFVIYSKSNLLISSILTDFNNFEIYHKDHYFFLYITGDFQDS